MSTIGAVALAIAAATPALAAPANAATCGLNFCTELIGSGNHITSLGAYLAPGEPVGSYSDTTGHLQVRWHAGGADHTKSGGDTLIDNAGHASVVGLNVNVDANTYVCGRIWDKDGSGYALYHGQNWQCIKTHP
ncbi:MAG TPA: hypothetical protein VHZ97_20245 [Pseudonocardiaceae bacterium]|nr:hypothetical protein [Pseudonocardiaceae bacterium]